MYESLMDTFRFKAEGLESPVFYDRFYPVPPPDDGMDQLWDDFNFARGLKQSNQKDQSRYIRSYDRYVETLRKLLNSVMADTRGARRGVVTIPSSKAGFTNTVTTLVRKVLSSNPRPFADLTDRFVRTRDRASSHLGGRRSIASNVQTLEVDRRCDLRSYDVLVVVDDILTSGTSFRAVDIALRNAGFAGTVVNFAFARTATPEAIELYRSWDDYLKANRPFMRVPNTQEIFDVRKRRALRGYRVVLDDGTIVVREGEYEILKEAGYRKVSTGGRAYRAQYDPTIEIRFKDGYQVLFHDAEDLRRSMKNVLLEPSLEGLVLDLDQTILDSAHRDARFEDGGSNTCPYHPYYGMAELFRLGIPVAVVSNRGPKTLRRIIGSDQMRPLGFSRPRDAFPGSRSGHDPAFANRMDDSNVFFFEVEEGERGSVRHYKPSPRSTRSALRWLRDTYSLDPYPRVLGVGNTLEDMIAYNAAGIESALALWGVPECCRAYAAANWGADYVFGSVGEMTDWIRARTRYVKHG